MKTDPFCLPCILNQCLRAGRMVSADPVYIGAALQEVAAYLADAPLDMNPSVIGTEAHRLMRNALGRPDPFKQAKHLDNQRALMMLGPLRERIKSSKDPLLEALRVSVAGNVMDFGAASAPDSETMLLKALEQPFPEDNYRAFLDELEKISNILFLADNAGEIVFDRLLVEAFKERGKGIMVAVKEGPVINDATFEDASVAGLHESAGIITTGCDSVGVNLALASARFRRRFRSAELILAKGQGHFETLMGDPGPIWRLFVVKCGVVAAKLNSEVGDVLFFRGGSR